MEITPLGLAQRFIGIEEVKGKVDNPQILAMLKLDTKWPEHDEVPWCSAFVNYIAWLLRLPRSKSLRARSWLNVGISIDVADITDEAYFMKGNDVVIVKQNPEDPGSEITEFRGHVGFLSGYNWRDKKVMIFGGNQGNTVSFKEFDAQLLLGIRNIAF